MKFKFSYATCEIHFEDAYYDEMVVQCSSERLVDGIWIFPGYLKQISPKTRGFSDREKAFIWNEFIAHHNDDTLRYEIDDGDIQRLNESANNPGEFQSCLNSIIDLIKRDEARIYLKLPVINHNLQANKRKIELPKEYIRWLYFSDGGELGTYQFYGINEAPLIESTLDGYEDSYKDFICIGSNGSGAIACKSGEEKIYSWDDFKLKFDEYDNFSLFLKEVVRLIKE